MPRRRPAALPFGLPPRAAPNSVAVLYFENNSPDTSDVYLAEGLTEELIVQLGRVRRLTVAPRSSIRRYRGGAQDPAAVARGLTVSHVVTGTVRRAGTRLRIDVELVRVPGQRLWGESYQRADGDLFAIQEDIARAVTSAVVGTLLPAERAALARAPTRDRLAYDLYLRGRAAFYREVTPAAAQSAIGLLEQALRRDPGFTAARGVLAASYGWAINWSLQVPLAPGETMSSRGLAIARQAVADDSLSADAWHGLGWILSLVDTDLRRAADAARRSVVLDSLDDRNRMQYAVVLRRMGDFEGSERHYRVAITINPAFDQAVADMGFLRLSQRRYREALPWYDSAQALLPSAWHHLGRRAEARLGAGDTTGALADARLSLATSTDATRHLAVARLATVEAMAGVAGARERLEAVLGPFATGALQVRDGFELGRGAGGDRAAGSRRGAARAGPAARQLALVVPGPAGVRRAPRSSRIPARAQRVNAA